MPSNSKLARKKKKEARVRAPKQTYNQMKTEIVDTLSGINGSMKEFAMGMEAQLNEIYNSKAGAKYGLKPG